MHSFGLSCEDAQDKDGYRVSIKGQSAKQIIWKMAVKTVCVVVLCMTVVMMCLSQVHCHFSFISINQSVNQSVKPLTVNDQWLT